MAESELSYRKQPESASTKYGSTTTSTTTTSSRGAGSNKHGGNISSSSKGTGTSKHGTFSSPSSRVTETCGEGRKGERSSVGTSSVKGHLTSSTPKSVKHKDDRVGKDRQTLTHKDTESTAKSKGGAKGCGLLVDSKDILSRLTYFEVHGDLFSCPTSFSLGHCVSEDLAMGRGVATIFKERFKSVGELKQKGVKTGGVAVLERDNRYIYYLVTKSRFFHKPTYTTLRSSLVAMKQHCERHDVKGVALPKIGCGLDHLSWDRVSEMIKEIFRDLEMTITVYYL